jgi:glucokinase
MSLHLGLDLGGTNVKWAVLDGERRTVAASVEPTYGDRGPEAVVARLVEVGLAAIARTGPVESVGVGVPGLYDRERGTTRFITNIPGAWDGVEVARPLAEALGAPTDLINDARAFTLAESMLGAGRGFGTVACLTLGTGVGGGVVVGGRLYEGLEGRAGELGHQTVDPSRDAPVCGCGNRGCVEAVYRAQRPRQDSSPEVVARAGAALGIALANTVLTLTPDRIVVGGGIATATGERLLEQIRRTVHERVRVSPICEIVPAELGSGAGAIGAALRGSEAR